MGTGFATLGTDFGPQDLGLALIVGCLGFSKLILPITNEDNTDDGS